MKSPYCCPFFQEWSITKSKQYRHESVCLGANEFSPGIPVQMMACQSKNNNQVSILFVSNSLMCASPFRYEHYTSGSLLVNGRHTDQNVDIL